MKKFFETRITVVIWVQLICSFNVGVILNFSWNFLASRILKWWTCFELRGSHLCWEWRRIINHDFRKYQKIRDEKLKQCRAMLSQGELFFIMKSARNLLIIINSSRLICVALREDGTKIRSRINDKCIFCSTLHISKNYSILFEQRIKWNSCLNLKFYVCIHCAYVLVINKFDLRGWFQG